MGREPNPLPRPALSVSRRPAAPGEPFTRESVENAERAHGTHPSPGLSPAAPVHSRQPYRGKDRFFYSLWVKLTVCDTKQHISSSFPHSILYFQLFIYRVNAQILNAQPFLFFDNVYMAKKLFLKVLIYLITFFCALIYL